MEIVRPQTESADNFTIRPMVELQLVPSAGDKESIRYVPRGIDDIAKWLLTKPA